MDDQEGQVHRNRISKTMAIFMISVAVFFDLLQFLLDLIPFVGWILSTLITPVAWLIFYTWTSLLGIGFGDTMAKALTVGKNKMLKWATALLEFVPGLDGLVPGITIGVVANIMFVWAEDTVYNASHGKVDVEKVAESAENHAKKRDTFRSGGQKLNMSDAVAAARENNLMPQRINDANAKYNTLKSNFSASNTNSQNRNPQTRSLNQNYEKESQLTKKVSGLQDVRVKQASENNTANSSKTQMAGERQGSRARGVVAGIGHSAIGGVKGVEVGAEAGAVIGSVIPVLGTAVGGAVGGAIGGVTGTIHGLRNGNAKEDGNKSSNSKSGNLLDHMTSRANNAPASNRSASAKVINISDQKLEGESLQKAA